MAHTAIYPIPGLPVEHLAEDGSRIEIRPLQPDDHGALLQFFKEIPAADRFFLKDDVTDPEIIEQWIANLDYSRALPLLALDGEQIVAEGILHHQRSGARRHTGEVRLVVHPAYRDKGIGRGLLHKLAELAQQEDVTQLLFEIVADKEEAARRAAMLVGFNPVAVLAKLVRDRDGAAHDLVLMQMNVAEQFPPRPNLF